MCVCDRGTIDCCYMDLTLSPAAQHKAEGPLMRLRSESLNIRTDKEINVNANERPTQTHTSRHYTTTK